MTCSTCVHYKKRECHRYPPVLQTATHGGGGGAHSTSSVHSTSSWVRPRVEPTDTCGEYSETLEVSADSIKAKLSEFFR
jgi:hypothetical protein